MKSEDHADNLKVSEHYLLQPTGIAKTLLSWEMKFLFESVL